MREADLHARVEDAFRENRPFLWGLSYRLTGNAADADDVVQETFVRALRRPPVRTDEPWRPWLVRVAVNLGRDVLRRRRRRPYDGPWLPSPIDTAEAASAAEDPEHGPEARYDLLESVTFAFLLALEALSPAQRAVLLLRDVFDYSVRETADALEMTEANVKTTHLRARRALSGYDRSRARPTALRREQAGRALQRFLDGLARQDVAEVASLLAQDARTISDGGGEYHAARNVIVGRDKVARGALGVGRQMGGVAAVQMRWLNGLPAAVITVSGQKAGYAPRVVLMCDVDATGAITHVYSVLASAKLAALA